MTAIDHGTIRNGKIHPSRVRLPSSAEVGNRRVSATPVHPSPSMRSNLAKRVQDLAHRQRTSESAIIDCALWLFFEKGQDANVMSLMGQAGIAPRRRRV